MKKRISWILGALCAASFCWTAIGAAAAPAGTSVAADPPPAAYEIYPLPHRIAYGDGCAEVGERVDVVWGAGVDRATRDALYRALDPLDVLAEARTTPGGDRYRIYVGIAGSGDAADVYAAGRVRDAGLFQRLDAYFLEIGANAATVLGKDTDAAFYGVATLRMILEQTRNRQIRTLTIEDWADCEYRGFIEGYYGIPWTTDERVSLMEFGGRFKSNIYIYAPKDDAYHSSNWRGLYAEGDLAELREQIAAGTATKNRFAWSIHPFLHEPITRAGYTEGAAAVERKFEQLYQAGVRQFVISADDVEVTEDNPVDASLHRDLLNRISAWCKQKGDCYDLIFVPSAYCYLSQTRLKVDLESYFAALVQDLDPDVTIMWTGNDVCSTIQSGKFDEFSALTGGRAFFWLNWPVNDYSTRHLLMGKAEVLNGTLSAGETPRYVGVVTNPMQQAEPSKPAIFAVADYCWNIGGFDADASYAASLAWVEPRETAAFAELCAHLSNATLYEGRYFAESVELAPLIDAFTAAYEADRDAVGAARALVEPLRRITAAAAAFLTNAANTALRDAMRPWVEALSLTAAATERYLDCEIHLGEWTQAELDAAFAQAQALEGAIGDCRAPVLNKISYNVDYEAVGVGVAVLTPFLQTLASYVRDDVLLARGESTGVTYRGFESIYAGEIADAADGDDASYVWFGSNPAENAYVRVDLGAPLAVGDIRTLTGKPDGGDVFRGYVEYSLDGKHFTALGTATAAEAVFDFRDRPITARFIRLRNLDTATWVAVREIAVNTIAADVPVIRYGNLALEPSVSTSPAAMTDGDPETYTWFDINRTEGAYLLLDLLKATEIDFIQLLMTKPGSSEDYFRAVKLQYSADGVRFTDLASFRNCRSILYEPDQPVTARYVRALSLETSANGVIVRDFSVNRGPAVRFGDGFALYDAGTRPDSPVSHPAYACDGDPETVLDLEALPGGARTLTLDLGAPRTLQGLSLLSGGVWGDAIESCVVSCSSDGETYTELGAFTSDTGEYDLTFDAPAQARYVRVEVVNAGWITLRELSARTAPETL